MNLKIGQEPRIVDDKVLAGKQALSRKNRDPEYKPSPEEENNIDRYLLDLTFREQVAETLLQEDLEDFEKAYQGFVKKGNYTALQRLISSTAAKASKNKSLKLLNKVIHKAKKLGIDINGVIKIAHQNGFRIKLKDTSPDPVNIHHKLAMLSGKEESSKFKINKIIKLLNDKSESCYEEFPASIAIASNIDTRDAYGKTVLMHAARNGDIDLVKTLLETGADINATDKSGNTVLMHAVRNGDIDLVKTLIETGSDINAADKNGKTTLMYALDQENTDLAEVLVNNGADAQSALEYALNKSKTSFAKQFCKVDALDADGKTRLMRALEEKDFSLAYNLNYISDDENIRDKNGKTTLMYAVENMAGTKEFSPSIAEIFIKGSDVNAADKSGKTALMYAVEKNVSIEVIKKFKEAGVKLDETNFKEILSCSDNKEFCRSFIVSEILEIFEDANFDNLNYINVLFAEAFNQGFTKDITNLQKDGQTILMKAAANGNEQVVSFLIELGADPKIVNGSGLTASKIAKNAGHEKIAKSLNPSLINLAQEKTNNIALFKGLNKVFTLLDPRRPKDEAA